MFAVQHRLPLVPVRTRHARRPFHPSQDQGAYRLPHAVRDRLTSSLAPFRNRDAAYALAVFLARFWSVPGRLAGSFPIDRRALADHAGLDLTEARVRGAIRTLEAIGFLDRAIPASGSLYKATPDGLHRKPILFVFGADYAPAFIAANARAAAARGRRSGERRPIPIDNTRRPSATVSKAPALKSPKSKSKAEPLVIMGELKSSSPPPPSDPNSPLEAALERWRRAAGWQASNRAALRPVDIHWRDRDSAEAANRIQGWKTEASLGSQCVERCAVGPGGAAAARESG